MARGICLYIDFMSRSEHSLGFSQVHSTIQPFGHEVFFFFSLTLVYSTQESAIFESLVQGPRSVNNNTPTSAGRKAN